MKVTQVKYDKSFIKFWNKTLFYFFFIISSTVKKNFAHDNYRITKTLNGNQLYVIGKCSTFKENFMVITEYENHSMNLNCMVGMFFDKILLIIWSMDSSLMLKTWNKYSVEAILSKF